MKAIVFDAYGSPDVLELRDIDRPVAKPDEVVVRVRATSANPYDWHLLTGLPYIGRLEFGPRGPRITCLGADLAGEVVSVGEAVTRFSPGDEVFGTQDDAGAFAEYVSASESALGHKPDNLTFEQAAAVPMAALTALQGLRDKGGIQPEQRVLINGASGGVGIFAVQIAKHFGATVTGVCSSRNVDLVRSIGADQVIDYTREDFTRGELRYDLMLDNVGNHPISACRRALKPKGVYVASFGQPHHRWLGPLSLITRMLLLAPFVSQKMVIFTQRVNADDLHLLKELIEAGKVAPVIDRTYPLREAADALRYLEKGHARGKVAITV